jgi:small-conductance mechanosensitive channel
MNTTHCACLRGFGSALLALSVFATAPAASLGAAPEPKPKPENAAAAPRPAIPIPLSQVAAEADSASAPLARLAAERRTRAEIDAIEAALPPLVREIDARAREDRSILAQRPSLELLRDLDGRWQDLRARLAADSERLKTILAGLDRELENLDGLEPTWLATLAAARQENAPAELLRRVQSVLADIAQARKNLTAQRTSALRIQGRVADLDQQANEALYANRRARDATVERMFSRDSAPLWYPNWRLDAAERISSAAAQTFARQWAILRLYMAPRAEGVVAQLLLFAVLTAVFVGARRRLTRLVPGEPGLRRVAAVVEHPAASALVLTLLAIPWFYPQGPRLLWAISGVAMLVPTIIVLRRLVAPYLLAPLYAVLAFFFVDQVRAVSASIDIVPRLLLMLEMIAAAGLLAWFGRTRRPAAEPARARSSPLRVAALTASVLCILAALANVFGYVALSNLVGNAVLDSLYVGLVLYTVVQLLDALAVIAMRVRPLGRLGMVRTHRQLLRRRTRRVLQWLAAAAWIAYLLDRLAVRDRAVEALQGFLRTNISLGEIEISLASILSFVLALWAAFLVSRFVRFVLNEEVFPRTHLGRGIPYAITRTIHFVIVALGFFIAMGVIGMEMTQFTILASAFTIGVGFGLQNIFNNFVSGLIVLFERPVQVGDMIQIDDSVGVVERIGIRATVVRTSSRSEVIVPNGKLISDRVVNWTLSGRQRVIELTFSVVLQSDPAQVIAILEQTAKAHPAVLQDPPAQAIVTRVGPDWIGIELRAAIADVEAWMTVRSELAVAAIAALRAAGVTLR